MKKLLIALCLALPVAAQAAPVTFNWSNTGSDGVLLSASGSFTVDDSDISAGFGNYGALITAFSFDWQTSSGDFSSSSASGDKVSRGFLNFSAGLELIGFDLCFDADGNCDAATSHPLIRIRNDLWGGTTGLNQPNFIRQDQQIAAAVPEPGSLALLGLGLVALGVIRRQTAG